MDFAQKRQAARWTATWAHLAELNLKQLEAVEVDDRMSEVVDIQALGLGLFSSLQKVRVGAETVLGKNHSAIEVFDAQHPDLRTARNMLDHFDAYV